MMGDVNCGGAVNSVDALLILRYIVKLSITATSACPQIGP
jgi:hypothetical protein